MLIGALVPFFIFICLQCQILKWVAFPIEHQSSGGGYVRRFRCWKGGGTSEKHRRIEIQETPKKPSKEPLPYSGSLTKQFNKTHNFLQKCLPKTTSHRLLPSRYLQHCQFPAFSIQSQKDHHWSFKNLRSEVHPVCLTDYSKTKSHAWPGLAYNYFWSCIFLAWTISIRASIPAAERGHRWSSRAHSTLLIESFGNHRVIKAGKHL